MGEEVRSCAFKLSTLFSTLRHSKVQVKKALLPECVHQFVIEMTPVTVQCTDEEIIYVHVTMLDAFTYFYLCIYVTSSCLTHPRNIILLDAFYRDSIHLMLFSTY